MRAYSRACRGDSLRTFAGRQPPVDRVDQRGHVTHRLDDSVRARAGELLRDGGKPPRAFVRRKLDRASADIREAQARGVDTTAVEQLAGTALAALIFASVFLSGCATRTVLVPPGEPVRLRETLRGMREGAAPAPRRGPGQVPPRRRLPGAP